MADGGGRTEHIETEAKFSAWPGFEVPDLTDAYDGLELQPGDDLVLDAVYYDTKDLRLIRRGVTVRHRSSATAGEWTVKVPEPGGRREGDRTLSRREINLDRPAGAVPDEIQGLVRAWTRLEPLEAVAHLQTRRRSYGLLLGGRRMAQIDDDEVSVLDGERIAARFREVEVEVDSGASEAEELMDAVTARLVEAGAGATDPTPKLVRALGPRALMPSELVEVADLGADPSIGEVVRAGITNAVIRLLDHDHVIRLDDDPEGVHQARVGTRRLRSDLRTFAPVLVPSWSEPLRDELWWLAAELGRVRDADVLSERLRHAAERLPSEADRDVAQALVSRLDRQRARAVEHLLVVLDSERYVALLERLVEAAHHPGLGERAGEPAAEVLPKLVARPWKKLRKDADRLGDDVAPEELHRVRILAKRARYAADVAVPVIGAPAKDLARRLTEVQDLLGDHQDAAVAEEWLRANAAAGGADEALVAGQLIAAERAHAAELRGRWPDTWKQLRRSRAAGWLA